MENNRALRVGDIVKYNAKWCRPEELNLRFVVIEERDHRDDKDLGVMRYLIRATTKIGAFYYTEQVDAEMIELA